MTIRWQDLSAQALEPVYNPRVAVADASFHLEALAGLSASARASLAADSGVLVEEDLRYGQGPLETLDLYRPQASHANRTAVPLVLFIHGGFWRALDKRDHSFVVPPLLGTGAVVANINYDLCPDVTLDVMVQEIVRALRFCHDHATGWGADPARLTVIGHSAGAHLAARLLNAVADQRGLPADLVAGMVGISGIYEPEIVTRISVNEQARIALDVARRNDCLASPPKGCTRLAVWAGGDEPAGWIAQTAAYAAVARQSGASCHEFTLAGTNHFTVLQRSMDTNSMAFRAIRAIVSG